MSWLKGIPLEYNVYTHLSRTAIMPISGSIATGGLDVHIVGAMGLPQRLHRGILAGIKKAFHYELA